MSSDNLTGGDNQQETREAFTSALGMPPDWVCGFVDGEGCFSVSVHRNPSARRSGGWQLYPVFQVSQHRDSRAVLEELASFFGVGVVRGKGARSNVLVYGVWGVKPLLTAVVPFFEAHPLRVKHQDFERFALVVRGLNRKEHLHPDGFEQLLRIAYSMNANGKQRSRTLAEVLGGSSETVREAP